MLGGEGDSRARRYLDRIAGLKAVPEDYNRCLPCMRQEQHIALGGKVFPLSLLQALRVLWAVDLMYAAFNLRNVPGHKLPSSGV